MKTKHTFRYDLFLASHLTHGKKRLTNIIKAAFRSPWMPVSPGTARNDLLLSVNVSFYFWESKREKETRLFPSMEPFCQTIFRDTVVLKNIVEPLFLLYTLFTLSYSNAPLHNLLFLIPFFALILWFHSLTLSLSLRHLPVYCSIFHLLLPVSQPPFIAFLSSPHLTEAGSSSKSPKAQSSTIVLITKLERESPGRQGDGRWETLNVSLSRRRTKDTR